MLLGIDRLVREDFRKVRGMKIGLLSTSSCCDSQLCQTISRFEHSRHVKLGALFAPEHGLHAALQDQVSGRDHFYGRKIPVHSMYGPRRKPAVSALKPLDAVVIDLQDIGTRYYTFAWSAMLMIEQAAKAGKKVIILDRPNPLDGLTVQGPLVESGFESFVGLYPVPVRHGLTIAELCTMLNKMHAIDCEIEVIRLRGWKRRAYFDETGLEWTVPSPNMPHLYTALVYPGMCLLEGTNLSEGRGTTRPFENFGAPWIDPSRLVAELTHQRIEGIALRAISFIPTFHKYRGRMCGGAQIHVTDRDAFDPLIAALKIIRTIMRLYPVHFSWRRPPYEFEKMKMPFDILVGNAWVRKSLEKGTDTSVMRKRWEAGLRRFRAARQEYLLYPGK